MTWFIRQSRRYFDSVSTADCIAIEVVLKEHDSMQLLIRRTNILSDHHIVHLKPYYPMTWREARAPLGLEDTRSIDQLKGVCAMLLLDHDFAISFVIGELRRSRGFDLSSNPPSPPGSSGLPLGSSNNHRLQKPAALERPVIDQP